MIDFNPRHLLSYRSLIQPAVWVAASLLLTAGAHGAAGEPPPILPATKIWDKAAHSAFTDLIRWQDKFYCAFREGSGHVPGTSGVDGTVRVLASDDGNTWKSVALLKLDKVDLRDPKLSVTPDGRLMIVMGGSYYDGRKLLKRIPKVAFMSAGSTKVDGPRPMTIDPRVAGPTDWLWRVTWHKGVGYGVVYQPGTKNEWGTHLLKTTDGVNYELVSTLKVEGRPNETTVRFTPNGEMRLLMRREGGNTTGMWGSAKPPYTDWSWRKLDRRLGGPNMVRLPDGRWLIGTREYPNQRPKGRTGTATVLLTMTDTGPPRRVAELPSGGDTSYPGMLIHDGAAWVSYYASHEGRSSIYIARIKLGVLGATAR